MNTWTTKAFHGRFTHRLYIDTQDLQDDPVVWLRASHGKAWRKLNHNALRGRQRFAVTIYCDRMVHDALISRYGDAVKHVSKPIDPAAEEQLKAGVEFCFRDKLWFGRYRYAIGFWMNRRNPLELQQWARQAFDGDRSQYQIRGRWFPMMYLRDETAVMMVRLAMQGQIYQTRRVVLLRELPDS